MLSRHEKTPVVVLRLDHYGALGIMRSLGRLGIPVYGVHRDGRALALKSKYCRGGLVWDLDAEPCDRSVARLLAMAEDLGGRPILIPSNDETALFVAENRARLRHSFRFAENSAELVHTLYSKRSMYFLAKRLGIPTAETLFPASRAEVLTYAESARFPVMLKGSDGISVSRRTGEKMVIVRTAEELLANYDRMEDPERPDLMIQEYIPGGEDAQWMWNGYFDEHSDCLFGITGRKLRQTPVYTGMTSLGICTRNQEIDALTRTFMKAIGYRGILDIGYRFDARDGSYKVLDVNPRLGATFRLFVGEDGMDVARALYLDLTGHAVPRSTADEGRRWFVEDLDLRSSVRYHQDGVLTVGDWLHSFRGIKESAWFASDDLSPFARMTGRLVTRAMKKATTRARGPIARAGEIRPEQSVQSVSLAPNQKELVRGYFDRSADYWKRIYETEQLAPIIYQERREVALRWIDGIGLPHRARALDVGCGAGHTAVALAQRGYRVDALDAAPQMIALTGKMAAEAKVRDFRLRVGDICDLTFVPAQFDLVVALGVLPWLESEMRALAEMARVLKPGGYLIATVDNRQSLHRLLDPRLSPLLGFARAALKRVLHELGKPTQAEPLVVKKHDPNVIDQLVSSVGLTKRKSASVGFGPFSLLGKKLLPETTDIRLHRRLQQLAEREWPLLRSTGAHYMVLAQKEAA